MNILYFPFDSQRCRFLLRIETKGNQSVVLRADPAAPTVTYAGPDKLQEFQLVNIECVVLEVLFSESCLPGGKHSSSRTTRSWSSAST